MTAVAADSFPALVVHTAQQPEAEQRTGREEEDWHMVMALRPVVDSDHVAADIRSGLAAAVAAVLPPRTDVLATVDDRMPEKAQEVLRMGLAEELHTAARTGSAEDLNSRTDTLQAEVERVVDTAQDMSPAEADDEVVVVKLDSLSAEK